jgi:hypothetical protein
MSSMVALGQAANSMKKHKKALFGSVKKYVKLGSEVDRKTIEVYLNGTKIKKCPSCEKTWKTKPGLMFMCSFNHKSGRKTPDSFNELIVKWKSKRSKRIHQRRVLLLTNRSLARAETIIKNFTAAGFDLERQ